MPPSGPKLFHKVRDVQDPQAILLTITYLKIQTTFRLAIKKRVVERNLHNKRRPLVYPTLYSWIQQTVAKVEIIIIILDIVTNKKRPFQ